MSAWDPLSGAESAWDAPDRLGYPEELDDASPADRRGARAVRRFARDLDDVRTPAELTAATERLLTRLARARNTRAGDH